MTLRGKCPRCCPDGGAIFSWHGSDKECNNCHLVLPVRRIKASGKPTTSQQETIDRVLSTFGGSVTKLEMIGRKAWIEIANPSRNWMLGNTVYGTIGARGKPELTLQRLFGDVKIHDDIDIKVYLN